MKIAAFVLLIITGSFCIGFSARGIADEREKKTEMPRCESGEIIYFHDKSQTYRCTLPPEVKS